MSDCLLLLIYSAQRARAAELGVEQRLWIGERHDAADARYRRPPAASQRHHVVDGDNELESHCHHVVTHQSNDAFKSGRKVKQQSNSSSDGRHLF